MKCKSCKYKGKDKRKERCECRKKECPCGKKPCKVTMCKAANCFVAGTKVGQSTIEQLGLGEMVRTWLPGEAGWREVSEPCWVTVRERVVWLAEVEGVQEVGLLRSEAWFAEHGLASVGDSKWLELAELGVRGRFVVVEIGEVVQSCYLVQAGWGRVTSLFRHPRGRVIDVRIEGESQAIGCTPRHPFWSEEAQDWVEAGKLQVGERVRTEVGLRAVQSVAERGIEAVFNIEVDSDHCYRVGEQGILVHNMSAEPCDTKCQKDGTLDPGLPNPNPVGELYAELYGTDSVHIATNTGFDQTVQVVKIIALNRKRNGGRVRSDDPADPFQELRSGPEDLYREEIQMGLVRWEDARKRFLVWVADGRRVDLVRLPGPTTGNERRGRQVAVVDHILSGNKGGSNSYCNARVISKSLNSRKGQKPIGDL